MNSEKENMKSIKSDIIFVGDVHGDIRELVWRTINQHNLKNVNLIILGDFGVGFGRKNYMSQLYSKISPKLEKYNITIYVVRGNHDNPEYFDSNHNFDRIKFLEDYKVFELNGFKFLPIGGAISLDQDWRKEYNKKMEKYGSSKRVWWKNELVKEVSIDSLPSNVDIIISHCAPISFEPIFVRNDWDKDIDLNIWEGILRERNYLEKVKSNILFKYWLFGHYHKSVSGNSGNILYRGLDIMEFLNLIPLNSY